MEAVVEFEYIAEQEDELTLRVGDVISNVQTAEGGWWEGELNGKKGMFPENFVKLVKRREPAPNKKEEKREATQRKSVRELASKLGNVPMGGPPKKKDKKKKCKVLFEYKKENDDELDLGVGDILDFHRQVEEGWWEGTLNGKHGVFPSNFVEMVDESASPDENNIPAGTEEKEKAAGDGHNKDSDFQTIKGKKVMGVGLGNIFGGGPIKLRAVGDSTIKEDAPKSPRPGDSTPDSAPEAAKREKQNTTERAIVRFSYTAEQPDELSLVEGQIVRILEKELEDEGWWKGEIHGKIGVFPDNFVELLPVEEPGKAKKPPAPPATTKQTSLPKLPEKSSFDTDEKIKAESQPPSIGKKPQAPPPIGKKPLNQKPVELKPEPVVPPNKPAGSVKDKPAAKENHSDNQHSEVPVFDDIEPAGQKLTHLTFGRAKGPKKRPPSTVLILNEGEKDSDFTEEIKNSHAHPVPEKQHSLPDKLDKPYPIILPKDSKHQPQHSLDKEPNTQSHQHAPSLGSLRDREPPSQAPPPRPPEPSTAPPAHTSAVPSIQMNKLIEQLQREINELKANSVSKATFSDLRLEHEKLKSEFENLKNNHSSKIRDLMNEVDEEKKLRLTTQVEIERVKKLMSETHV
ncbi:hypothetical protein BsWGS_12243 [Bradybaena similaris]